MRVYEANFYIGYATTRENIRTIYALRKTYTNDRFLLDTFYHHVEISSAKVENVFYLLRYSMAMSYEKFFRERWYMRTYDADFWSADGRDDRTYIENLVTVTNNDNLHTIVHSHFHSFYNLIDSGMRVDKIFYILHRYIACSYELSYRER